MKSLQMSFVLLGVVLLCHKISALTIEQELLGDQVVSEHRVLTAEEEVLANEARSEIARAIESNLIRIFAIITAQQEHPYLRQEDDGDDSDLTITPNPNVLPQVAQILGAIFSGTLNITRIADSTVGLVPNLIRNQLQGLVKLLTGENVNLSGSTTTAVPSKETDAEGAVTDDVIFEGDEVTPTAAPSVSVASVEETTAAPVVEAQTEISSTTEEPTTTEKLRYKVMRNRTRRTTTVTPLATNLVDDEVERIERDIIAAGRLLEPYEQDREPRIYAGLFSTILKNVNMTEVAKAVPTIFKGANQAFVMLENLGVLDTLPGADVLEDIEIGLEQEE